MCNHACVCVCVCVKSKGETNTLRDLGDVGQEDVSDVMNVEDYILRPLSFLFSLTL